MITVYRDFNKPNSDIGTISVSLFNDGTICVIVFGLHDEDSQSVLKIKHSEKIPLYNSIKNIFDKLTEDYDGVTYRGYNECIINNLPEELIDNGIIWDYSKYNGCPTLEFKLENIKYITNHDDGFLDETDVINYGEVLETGEFIYNRPLVSLN